MISPSISTRTFGLSVNMLTGYYFGSLPVKVVSMVAVKPSKDGSPKSSEPAQSLHFIS